MKTASYILAALIAAAALTSCTVSDDFDDSYERGKGSSEGSGDYPIAPSGETADEGGGSGLEPGGQGGNSQAGRVTAGEWCDLDHWVFWSDLMSGTDYGSMSEYWGFWTNNRVAFHVADKEGKPLAGVKINLVRGESTVWTAVTDNRGRAEAWIGMMQKETNPSGIEVLVDGQKWDAEPQISTWNQQSEAKINEIVLDAKSSVEAKADIAFIVDATGSMGDEIAFLKDDLLDILKKVEADQSGITFRTGALFYRDEGDEYVTRPSDFTTDFSKTTAFIGEQNADGGGDYPEAVHTALEESLTKLSWDKNAKIRIAFMLLDAPAHHEDAVIKRLQNIIPFYSRMGIRIIPIAASGVDKTAEFMLRFFALATGGTYVFITNDSGIGGDHIVASVGDYQVELLNELIIRLIKEYTD